jgi:hypothetical protein
MSIKTVYVQGTKKAANERLVSGDSIECVNYTLGSTSYCDMRTLAHGDVIKFWSKRDPWGAPVAKSYGNWNAKKGRVD